LSDFVEVVKELMPQILTKQEEKFQEFDMPAALLSALAIIKETK
jgi:hypothetical protein